MSGELRESALVTSSPVLLSSKEFSKLTSIEEMEYLRDLHVFIAERKRLQTLQETIEVYKHFGVDSYTDSYLLNIDSIRSSLDDLRDRVTKLKHSLSRRP